MDVQDAVRGQVAWPRLERVVRELAARYDRERVHVRFLEADNWLSTPMVVDDEWFVKVVSPRNSLVHALFTTGRNLGAFSAGSEGFFDHFDTPAEMAAHELEATRRMREFGVAAPEPVESFEVEDLGVVVLEYVPDHRPLGDVDAPTVVELATSLFTSLARLHDHGLAHGDLRAENVLVREVDGERVLTFIDATSVREDGRDAARGYDLASAMAALEPLIGAGETVAAARDAYDDGDLLAALDFLDFVNIRPDHDFDAAALKGELGKRLDDPAA